MIEIDAKTKNANFESFRKVYFSDSQDFKTQLLPIWTGKFSSLISLEQNHKIGNYYKKFNQGTIVMVDFGVRIGGEISGGHFGVVLNKEDNKHERNIIVVPLTSKEKNRYVSLDYEVMEECSKLLNKRSDSCLQKIESLEKEKDAFIKEFQDSNTHFSFSNEIETTVLRENGIEDTSSFKINISSDLHSNDDFYNTLNNLKPHRNFSKAKNV